jgi:diguanylate cyclase (GGDEF)-like protein/PAS domain S-box-containing protein
MTLTPGGTPAPLANPEPNHHEARSTRWTLADETTLLRTVLEQSSDVTMLLDEHLRVLWHSPSLPEVCPPDTQSVLGAELHELIHPDDVDVLHDTLVGVAADSGSHQRCQIRSRHRDGSLRWIEARITNLAGADGRANLMVNGIDITDRQLAQDELQRGKRFLQAVLDAAYEGVLVMDFDGTIRFANARLAEMFGQPAEAGVGRPLEAVVDAEVAAEARRRLLWRQAGLAERYEMQVSRSDGSEMWLSVSAAPLPPDVTPAAPQGGTVALIADVSDRKAYERALLRRALHDPLTELPNRALLAEQRRLLDERLNRAGVNYSYLSCDINGMKLINDALGAAEGDRLIREIAQRLASGLREGDWLARANGDQFVVLCANTESFQAERIARDLVEAVASQPTTLAESTVWPSISVGVASTSDVAPDHLSSAADSALLRAKLLGRGSVAVFDAAAPQDHLSMLEMLVDLRAALGTDALRLHYQPIVRLNGEQIVAAEALMRWHRPGHGEIPPAVFIPLAERDGLIAELGAWSVRQACLDAAAWAAPLSVSVNLSARQLADDAIVDVVRAALDESRLSPERLTLEVTETAVLGDVPAAIRNLHALTELGARICLDDFGTGYSSLAYLRDLPVQAIKIDRSFVAGMEHNPDDAAIVATLVSLARSIDITVTAEGIETARQLTALRGLGCGYGQGYLWGEPLPQSDFRQAMCGLQGQPLTHQQRASTEVSTVPQAIVQRIFAMHRRGASAAAIAAAMNGEGVPAPLGTTWHRHTVAHLITDTERSG